MPQGYRSVRPWRRRFVERCLEDHDSQAGQGARHDQDRGQGKLLLRRTASDRDALRCTSSTRSTSRHPLLPALAFWSLRKLRSRLATRCTTQNFMVSAVQRPVLKERVMTKAIGIDLAEPRNFGTRVMEGNTPKVIENARATRTTHSMVRIRGECPRWLARGQAAAEHQKSGEHVFAIKPDRTPY